MVESCCLGFITERMSNKYTIALAVGLLAIAQCVKAEDHIHQPTTIVVSPNSIRIGRIELRSGPRQRTSKYISLAAAERVLGYPDDQYTAGLGVTVYSWRKCGIHLQKGWRGDDKGKVFKFQVYLHNDIDRLDGKSTHKFLGHVQVDGLDISATTKFDDIREELQERGCSVKTEAEDTSADKGAVSIFTVGTTNEIERVEVWCPS